MQSNYGELESKYGDLQSRHEAVRVERTEARSNWGELEVLVEPERRVLADKGGAPTLEPVLATVKRLTLKPFDKLPEDMISNILVFVGCSSVKELVQGYGTVDKVWRGCASSPLVHKQLVLPGSENDGFSGYKDVESEEDMLKIVGRVATSVPGLRDLKFLFDKSKFVNTECLRVIAKSFRKLGEVNIYYSELITD